MATTEPSGDDPQGAIDRALAAILRGVPAGWPLAGRGEGDVARVLARVGHHGLAGLLASRGDALADWPAAAREGLRGRALAAAMWEARHRSIVVPLIEALAAAGVGSLVLKGTALAHSLYASPAERARSDTDLLVARTDLPRAREVLLASGFVLDPAESAMPPALRLQELWERDCADGAPHQVDLHTQVFNAPALLDALPVADLFARAVPLAGLCPVARTLDPAAMLLHLAMHRAVHRVSPYFVEGRACRGDDRLIWLVDVARVAGSMDDAAWERLLYLARRAGAGAVCREALAIATDRLGHAIPAAVRDALARQDDDGAASAYLLQSGAAARAWRNLRAVAGLRARAAYLLARAFPPAAFMRAKFPGMGRWPLPLLYLRRACDLARGG